MGMGKACGKECRHVEREKACGMEEGIWEWDRHVGRETGMSEGGRHVGECIDEKWAQFQFKASQCVVYSSFV